MDNDILEAIFEAVAKDLALSNLGRPWITSHQRGKGKRLTAHMPDRITTEVEKLIFKTLDLVMDVDLLEDQPMFHVRVNLAYTHPGGGSNGIGCGTYWADEKGTLLQKRTEGGEVVKL